jgi:hypothetical protein
MSTARRGGVDPPAGLDGGICLLADCLLKEIAFASGSFAGPRTAVPAVLDASQILGPTIGVRFPDWTVWTVPLVAHRYAHLIAQDNRQLIDLEERLASQFSEAQPGRRATEFLADGIATWMVGPAYACAAMLLMFRPDRSLDGVTDAERARVILGILGRPRAASPMSHDAPELSRLIGLLQSVWSEFLAPGSIYADEWTEFDSVADALVDGLDQSMPRLAAPSGHQLAEAEYLAAKLRDPAAIERSPIGSELSMRDLLNAAWIARVAQNEAPEAELERAILDLAFRVAEGRGDNARRRGQPL